ncbi:MAG: hypothetical protein PUI05_05785 [Peptoniphilaceae bacterium]|nr:hypothetical protein [Peptoniphilaceae bacterium]
MSGIFSITESIFSSISVTVSYSSPVSRFSSTEAGSVVAANTCILGLLESVFSKPTSGVLAEASPLPLAPLSLFSEPSASPSVGVADGCTVGSVDSVCPTPAGGCKVGSDLGVTSLLCSSFVVGSTADPPRSDFLLLLLLLEQVELELLLKLLLKVFCYFS